jgi:hypothetical protein
MAMSLLRGAVMTAVISAPFFSWEANADGQTSLCHNWPAFDHTYPTNKWFSWNSSSGASGTIEYGEGQMGSAVPVEVSAIMR